MNRIKFLVVLAAAIITLDLFAVLGGIGVTGNLIRSDDVTGVSRVYSNVLLGERVKVRGRVSEVMDDHVSGKGYLYQQFMITEGGEEIKVFCSVKFVVPVFFQTSVD